MNHQRKPISFQNIGLAAAAGILLAIGLAWAFFRVPSLLFTWGNNEYLSILFARGYFSHITKDLLPGIFFPAQQINLPVSCVVILADWLSIDLHNIAWICLSVLGGIFLYRTQQLLEFSDRPLQRLVFVGLLFVHPFFWIILSTSPGNLLIACLAMETVISSQKSNGMGKSGWIALFFLSLCGSDGFVWSILLTLSIPIAQLFSSRIELPSALRRFGLLASAAAPMGFIYLILTLQYGQMGGARLSDFPCLFSEFHPDKLLSGEWTLHARQWLIWFSNGCLSLPVIFPLSGVLTLLGMVDGWTKTGESQRFSREIGTLFVLYFLTFSFASSASARECSMPLFPLAIFFTLRGILWIGDSFSLKPQIGLIAISGVLAGIQMLSFPSEWSPKSERALYYHNLWEKIDREINPRITRLEDSMALRFDPAVFCRLSAANRVYPIGLSLEAPFQCIAGWKSGVFFDVRFAPSPLTVVLFPRFEEIDSPAESSGFFPLRIREELDTFYQSERFYNLTVYRRNASPNEIVKSWLRSAYEDGYDFEIQWLADWFATRFHPASNASISLSKDSLPTTVGTTWTFERDYRNTRQTGFAFGSSPSSDSRAAGASIANSGTPETESRLGVLESEPFIIEGEEMSFYANLPKDSTSTFFCLAVYEETEFGPHLPVKKARHLFERNLNESLMEDTFFYIHPENLAYWPGRISGWRVVRILQKTEFTGWDYHRWSLDPWREKQAIWLAADRDVRKSIGIDQIVQWKRAPGLYYNFESGEYKDWQKEGSAFGEKPATSSIGEQREIEGFEGNYFINTFYQGSDSATGLLRSTPFELRWNRMKFRIGGGNDRDRLFIGLRVENELVIRATGNRSENLIPETWDLTPWIGKTVQIEIADQSPEAWGHILVDDIRIDSR